MASITKHTRGGYYLELYPLPGVRRRIYLGKITKGIADRFLVNIARLEQAKQFNLEDLEMNIWASGLDAKLQNKLRENGISIPAPKESWSVAKWLEHIATTYPGTDRTVKNVQTSKKHWSAMLGAKQLHDVTVADCRLCMEQLKQAHAPSHGSKIFEHGKMFFARAIEAKIITESPFAGLTFGNKKHDKARQNYVTRDDIEKVIAKATELDAKALIALARYCGLRVPSEPLALTWSDLDFDLKRIRIPSDTKTGSRTLPMFEAYQHLQALPKSSSWVFPRARASSANAYREWLEEAIAAAKLEQWPKLWVNLRASCRTDLEDLFPVHVCNAWLGHSTRVARDHYDMVSPDHWAKASRTGDLPSARGGARKTRQKDAKTTPN